MLPCCTEGVRKACAEMWCPKQERKKEVKAFVEAGMVKLEEVKHFVDKTGNKTSFVERRLMTGLQGYRIVEVFRQICNSFEEWDVDRYTHCQISLYDYSILNAIENVVVIPLIASNRDRQRRWPYQNGIMILS